MLETRKENSLSQQPALQRATGKTRR